MTAAPRRRRRRIAVIDEERCIGCTLCIKACPVDAIVGAHTFMHAVVEHECIGCELCVKPCPTDCIEMITTRGLFATHERALRARERRKHRDARLTARAREYAAAMVARRERLKAAIQRKSVAREEPGQGR